ncbi:MAG: alpha/beta hydrolase [Armatimonadota bacterium]
MPDIITYKHTDGFDLTLHAFFPPDHDRSSRRPAIVFFFGGGWVGGTPTQFYPHCDYLAARGMVAMSAEYRVASVHGTTPYQCVTDGKSAVRWIRQHAAELGIDPDRLAAGGGSAGGQVAAAAGMCNSFDDPAEDQAISSKPNALVLFNPVFDNGPDGYAHERVKDRWQEFSPLHNIAAGAPPTIIFLGTEDHVLPVPTAEEYQRCMATAGSRCDLRLYPGEKHGFFNYRDGSNPYYSATLYEADRFLVSLGYLDGEPAMQSAAVEAILL